MSILSNVTKGKIQRPHLLLIYGPDGQGKSSLAAGAPAPIFLGAEDGTNHLDTSRVGIPNLKALHQVLDELAGDGHDFKTAVFDTLDWMERLVYADVIANWPTPITSIDDPGYGKGRVRAFELWNEILPKIEKLRSRGMHTVALAHSMVKKFEDPTTPQGYERYSLKLQDGAKSDVAGLWREFVDAVLFLNTEVVVSKDDKRRGFGDGARVLYTERRPGFDAKNRLGLPLEIRLPYEKDPAKVPAAMWGALEAELTKSTPAAVNPEDLKKLAEQVTDAKLRQTVLDTIKAAGEDQQQLAKVKTRLLTLLNNGKK